MKFTDTDKSERKFSLSSCYLVIMLIHEKPHQLSMTNKSTQRKSLRYTQKYCFVFFVELTLTDYPQNEQDISRMRTNHNVK